MSEVRLMNAITFTNDMPRKRFHHDRDGITLSVEDGFVWVTKTTKRGDEVVSVEEQGTPLVNVEAVFRVRERAEPAYGGTRPGPGRPARSRVEDGS